MRLLMITRKMDRDDAQAGFNFLWAKKLSQKVDLLKVICLEKGNVKGLPKNIEIFSLGKERGKNKIKEFLNFQKGALKFINKVDGIFCHQNPEYTILIGPWGKLFGKKIVSWYSHKAINWRVKLMTFFANKVVTPTQESFGLKTEKKITIGHGIDIEMFKPVLNKERGDVLKIVSVGRIDPIKNYETLIEAIRIIKQEIEIKVKIVGPVMFKRREKYLEELKSKVQEYGMGEQIDFVGPVSYLELPSYLQKVDLSINLCPTGSPDKAVLEAMACETPVLVANETFRDDFGPYADKLIFKHSDAQDLAKKIIDLAESSQSKEIGLYLREQVVENHNLDNLIKKIIDVFKENY